MLSHKSNSPSKSRDALPPNEDNGALRTILDAGSYIVADFESSTAKCPMAERGPISKGRCRCLQQADRTLLRPANKMNQFAH
jgi:hypothetical protein